MEFTEWETEDGIPSLGAGRGEGMNELVKIYFIIGMFLINAKPILCSEKLFHLATNKFTFSYLLICKPLCGSSRALGDGTGFSV